LLGRQAARKTSNRRTVHKNERLTSPMIIHAERAIYTK